YQAMRIAIPALIVAMTAGTDTVQTMLSAIPDVVTTGLKIAGGFIAVVGYAMVINMMRAGHLMPFFYAGFVIAAFTEFNLVALGVLGAIMDGALYSVFTRNTTKVASGTSGEQW
ncbi:PTS system mannose-specific transporter subunit IIC, partial [Pasteurella multocida subsp. multocida str. Anand1_cattle]